MHLVFQWLLSLKCLTEYIIPLLRNLQWLPTDLSSKHHALYNMLPTCLAVWHRRKVMNFGIQVQVPTLHLKYCNPIGKSVIALSLYAYFFTHLQVQAVIVEMGGYSEMVCVKVSCTNCSTTLSGPTGCKSFGRLSFFHVVVTW